MAIYLGTNRITGMYLGTERVVAAYLGTELIYSEGGLWTLYDNGFVQGCEWAFGLGSNDASQLPSAGADLILPRPCQETGVGSRYISRYNASDYDTYMRLYMSGPTASRLYSSSVVTAQKIIVPVGATSLNMDVYYTYGNYSSNGAYCAIGLYPDGTGPIYTDSSLNVPTGAIANAQRKTGQGNYTIPLAVYDSMWGQSMYVAISICATADQNKILRVKKVYFTQ